MKCKNCGRENEKENKFCVGCGTQLHKAIKKKSVEEPVQQQEMVVQGEPLAQPVNSIQQVQQPVYSQPMQPAYAQPMYGGQIYGAPKKSNKGLIIGLSVGIPAFILILVGFFLTMVFLNANKTYGYNDTFKFDGLSITIGDNVSFNTVSNKYSSYYGEQVVAVPITIRNNSFEDKKLNMFYYTVTNHLGSTCSTSISSYYSNSSDYAGYLDFGESYTKYLYFIYKGDGIYTIDFDNYSEQVKVKIRIEK